MEAEQINDLYTYLRGARPKDVSDISTAKKLKIIHSFSKVNFHLKDRPFELTHFQHLINLKEVKIFFQFSNLQYSQALLRTLFTYKNIEVIELVNYPLSFFPKGIENLENLKVLKCISSEVENMDQVVDALPKLETLDFTNSKISSISRFLEKLPKLKKLTLSKTKLSSKCPDLKNQFPNCKIIA